MLLIRKQRLSTWHNDYLMCTLLVGKGEASVNIPNIMVTVYYFDNFSRETLIRVEIDRRVALVNNSSGYLSRILAYIFLEDDWLIDREVSCKHVALVTMACCLRCDYGRKECLAGEE